jgi:hypothetical protein
MERLHSVRGQGLLWEKDPEQPGEQGQIDEGGGGGLASGSALLCTQTCMFIRLFSMHVTCGIILGRNLQGGVQLVGSQACCGVPPSPADPPRRSLAPGPCP